MGKRLYTEAELATKKREWQRKANAKYRASLTDEERATLRESMRTYAKAKSAALTPAERRDRQIRLLYKITLVEVEALLAVQGGCAVCLGQTPGSQTQWHVDHDHITKAIRGVLCSDCNRVLGQLGDTPQGVALWSMRLTRYLLEIAPRATDRLADIRKT